MKHFARLPRKSYMVVDWSPMMPATVRRSRLLLLVLLPGLGVVPARADPALVSPGSGPATTSPAVQLAGLWTLSLDKSATCRLMLRPQRTDAGDYFLGMPTACRHAMPQLETVGRWSAPDATHLTLDNPAGKPVLALAASGEGGFRADAPEGTYAMAPMRGATSRSVGFDAVDTRPAEGFAMVRPIAMKEAKEPAASRETSDDLAGRYAVMREKRDTGCMVTLDDKSRVKGGVRAQLAPGCRDQGIVIFDPSAWQLVKGQLVLIARAGHKTVLEKKQDGVWEKDAKEGGKPLGLKKL